MSLNEEVELLRKIPLFANLEPSKLKLLAFTSDRITYDEGQILFRQGDMGDAAYIIIEGEAEVRVGAPTGDIVVATLSRNDFVGEIAILCDGTGQDTGRDAAYRQGPVLPADRRVSANVGRDHARTGVTARAYDGAIARGDRGDRKVNALRHYDFRTIWCAVCVGFSQ